MKVMDGLYAFLWSSFTENNCNTYLITGNKNIIIDPGHYHLFGHVKQELQKLNISISDIDVVLITHAHLDHMEGIDIFKNSSTIYGLHNEEWVVIKKGISYHMGVFASPEMKPHFLLKQGELIVGEEKFEIIHTPGHSPGSICIYWHSKKVLFTGDSIFEQGVGRTDLPGGNGNELRESIRNISKLGAWNVLPGHGNMIIGKDEVDKNFKHIEEFWFPFL